ncbi:hypothetical protein DACRYDRAFT_15148 [Dacryopinax primogenitus]|uniref:Uncharacterized protein n=1 Tax=Dacryopinax primogenitus (strain DJM 731) TaxID=1858805 RepID=M5FZ19_DACPD|nr:uncharacterized protein DACRYDRAFT_15148 [Dacryopinax primogenitus]EJU03291.1 hypothetical protein DACRYDRAFT_15148 [Dacryopinax primogenitus]
MSDVATRPSRRRRHASSSHAPTSPETSRNPASPDKRRPSIATDDRTELELLVLSTEEFEKEVERRLGLGRPGAVEEATLSEPVLLPRPKTKEEEEALHAKVMDLLRARVTALEKEEDPEFDPLCPLPQDLAGIQDDPLFGKLETLATQIVSTQPCATGIPERL